MEEPERPKRRAVGNILEINSLQKEPTAAFPW
jgi:hypothetical protein